MVERRSYGVSELSSASLLSVILSNSHSCSSLVRRECAFISVTKFANHVRDNMYGQEIYTENFGL